MSNAVVANLIEQRLMLFGLCVLCKIHLFKIILRPPSPTILIENNFLLEYDRQLSISAQQEVLEEYECWKVIFCAEIIATGF